ncbi:MAG: arylsulfotransferase family protein [Acidobacteriota bacterium]
MRRRIAVWLLLGAGLVAVALWLRESPWPGGESAIGAGVEAPPAGRWRPLPPDRRTAGPDDAGPASSARGDAEERARVLSLPYAAGVRRAEPGTVVGVVAWAPVAAWPGVNLEVSGHASEAVLRAMDGEVLHRWRMPFERAFPEIAPNAETVFFRRAALRPEGRLIALYQTGGLVELGPQSNIVRRCAGSFYNDFFVQPGRDEANGDEGGEIWWSLAKEARRDEAGREVLEDFVVALRPGEGTTGACEELWRMSVRQALSDSPFAAVLEPRRAEGDVFHSNTIEVFDGSLADASPLFAAGNVLVSLREISTVAVLDGATGRALWAQRGPWRLQHQPTPHRGDSGGGRLLIFDNRGAPEGSRLLEIELPGGEVVWRWQADPPRAFSTPEAGSVERLPNGNLLVTESERGRAFELSPGGQVVWDFQTPHRAGRDNGLVATLMEVVRYPAALWEPPRDE